MVLLANSGNRGTWYIYIYGSNLLGTKIGSFSHSKSKSLRNSKALETLWLQSQLGTHRIFHILQRSFTDEVFLKVNQEKQGKIGETHFALDFFQGRW